MFFRKLRWISMVFATIFLVGNVAWAEYFGLGGTPEQHNLQLDVEVTDHSTTGRVTVSLSIADEGNLKPLNSVDLVIPSKEGNGPVDLSVPLAIREVDGKRLVRVHLIKSWAERAEIQLRTSTLNGKQEPLTGWYYSIPIAKYLENGEQEANQ